jgi:hypothetical protein
MNLTRYQRTPGPWEDGRHGGVISRDAHALGHLYHRCYELPCPRGHGEGRPDSTYTFCSDEQKDYGGKLICESISRGDAEFMIALEALVTPALEVLAFTEGESIVGLTPDALSALQQFVEKAHAVREIEERSTNG